MYDESAVFIVRETLIVALMIMSPILLAGVAIGLVVSLVQSVTSIQDQTLTFVPKIAVMIVVAAILLPWIVLRLVEFAAKMVVAPALRKDVKKRCRGAAASSAYQPGSRGLAPCT